MRASQKRIAIRSKLRSGQSVRLAGAHNGLSARLVEQAGFEAVWASGLEISASQGLPDDSILGMSDLLRAASEMDRACSLPIIADCDTGFGDIDNVIHLVREYERAGIAGVCIEDKCFPKHNSFSERAQKLLPVQDFTAKLRAAKLAQSEPGFLLLARTEAFIAGEGVEVAVERALAYEAAGADMVVVHSRRTDVAELTQFSQRWTGRVPLVAIPTTYPETSVPALRGLGFQVVIFANQGLRAAIGATRSALSEIASKQSAAISQPELVPVAEIFALQQVDEWASLRSKALFTGAAKAAESDGHATGATRPAALNERARVQ